MRALANLRCAAVGSMRVNRQPGAAGRQPDQPFSPTLS